jgi:hypothetical protein
VKIEEFVTCTVIAKLSPEFVSATTTFWFVIFPLEKTKTKITFSFKLVHQDLERNQDYKIKNQEKPI